MLESARIVVVGSLNLDLVARPPRFPHPGETLIGGDFHTAPGGKGANQAIAAARLGAHVSMVGRLGKDDFSRPLIASLNANGIDQTHLILDETASTGVAVILVDDTGQNCIVVSPGANARLTIQDIDAAMEIIRGSQVFLTQLESPLEAVFRAVEIAHAHDVKVILNPAPANSQVLALLPYIDMLIPNESEAALLTGIAIHTIEDAVTAARMLCNRGAGAVIVTLGAQGCVYVQGDRSYYTPAFQVDAIDTTAAGDAFVGAFAVALAERMQIEQSVVWGCAAGALATTRLGAQPSLPTRVEVEAFLKEHHDQPGPGAAA